MASYPITDMTFLTESANNKTYYILVWDPYFKCFVQFGDKNFIEIKYIDKVNYTTIGLINNTLNTFNYDKDVYIHMIDNPTLYRHNNVYNSECKRYERIIITPICVFNKNKNIILSIVNYNPNCSPCKIYNEYKQIKSTTIEQVVMGSIIDVDDTMALNGLFK